MTKKEVADEEESEEEEKALTSNNANDSSSNILLHIIPLSHSLSHSPDNQYHLHPYQPHPNLM